MRTAILDENGNIESEWVRVMDSVFPYRTVPEIPKEEVMCGYCLAKKAHVKYPIFYDKMPGYIMRCPRCGLEEKISISEYQRRNVPDERYEDQNFKSREEEIEWLKLHGLIRWDAGMWVRIDTYEKIASGNQTI